MVLPLPARLLRNASARNPDVDERRAHITSATADIDRREGRFDNHAPPTFDVGEGRLDDAATAVMVVMVAAAAMDFDHLALAMHARGADTA